VRQRTARAIAGSQFKIYEDAAHALYLTHKDRLNRDLLEFIRKLSGSQARWHHSMPARPHLVHAQLYSLIIDRFLQKTDQFRGRQGASVARG